MRKRGRAPRKADPFLGFPNSRSGRMRLVFWGAALLGLAVGYILHLFHVRAETVDIIGLRFILRDETRTALSAGVLAFVVGVPALWKLLVPRKPDPDHARIERKIDRLDQKLSTPRPAPQVPKQEPPPGRRVDITRLPTTGPDLFGRDAELAQLDKAWDERKINVIGFRAWGGVGKSALVNHWLTHRMQPAGWRGAELVLGWSFYSQGAAEGKQVSAEPFIDSALRWFDDPDPTLGSAWDRGRRLADLVRKQRTLLILDGLEPLQNPPGAEPFKIKDHGLLALLKGLAADNPGLCVITTRFEVPDLDNWAGTTVHIHELARLPKEAGVELLKSLGVDGTDKELEDAVEDVKGHALAVTLLGHLLVDEWGGDIRKRWELPPLEEDEEKGGHARRVMQWYQRVFAGKPELDILRMMGLFDRPARLAAIAELRAEPPIQGITESLKNLKDREWNAAVRHLQEAGLLAKEDESDTDELDCHPLIREHFGEKLKAENPDGWKEAHHRLYEYYKSVPEKEFPDTLEEMAPLLAAVAHGCQAGLYEDAFDDVYWRRIARGNEFYLVKKLGAFGADLAAVSGFFEEKWSRPVVELREGRRAWFLNEAGYDLRALGCLLQAAVPMEAALNRRLSANEWAQAARSAGNLSELCLAVGRVPLAVDHARRAVECADKSREWKPMVASRTTLADALHQLGTLDVALDLFVEAEGIQNEHLLEYPFLSSVQGYQYCELLLAASRFVEAMGRATQAIRIAQKEHWLLDIALDHLSLGRAHLLQAEREDKGKAEEAEKHLNEAVDGLRAAGMQDFLPRGLLARAHLYRFKGDFDAAKLDIDEAFEIAERGEMGLHQADCRLEYARLYLAENNKPEARRNLDIAREMIERMGYHRRDGEVKELEAALG